MSKRKVTMSTRILSRRTGIQTDQTYDPANEAKIRAAEQQQQHRDELRQALLSAYDNDEESHNNDEADEDLDEADEDLDASSDFQEDGEGSRDEQELSLDEQESGWMTYVPALHNRLQQDLRQDGKLPVATKTSYRMSCNFQQKGSNLQFRNIVIDECHLLRHSDSTYHILGLKLPRGPQARLLLVSATPTLNSVKDMRGLTRLIAEHAQLPLVIEHAHDTYLDLEFDPFSKKGLNDDEGRGIPPIFKDIEAMSPQEQEKKNQLHAWFLKDPAAHRFWVLHPNIYKKISSSHQETRNAVYQQAIRLLQSRRTMKTPLSLPNGKIVFPGSSIPPTTIKTIEVAHKPGSKTEALVHELTDFFIEKLHSPPPQLKDKHLSDINSDKIKNPDDDSARINMAIHRIAQIISFDARAYTLFFDEDAAKRDPIARVMAESIVMAQSSIEPSVKLHATQRAILKRARARAQGSAQPKLGAQHVAEIEFTDPDGGLT